MRKCDFCGQENLRPMSKWCSKSCHEKYSYRQNLEYHQKKNINYRKQNKHKIKDHYQQNKERLKKASRKYYEKNKKELDIKRKTYYQKNKHRFRERINAWHRQQYATNIQYKLKTNLRRRLRRMLEGKYKRGSAVKDLGCSIEDLKRHLESQFQPGMSWENYGEWHIDHIKPLSKFDLTDLIELQKACNYTNLQPLWAVDNIKKSDK